MESFTITRNVPVAERDMSRDMSWVASNEPNERLIFPNNNKNRVLVLIILYCVILLVSVPII